jgi:hypothetical protein
VENNRDALERQQADIAALEEKRAAFEAAVAEAESDVEALRTEKELQAGGTLRELQEQADALSKRCVGVDGCVRGCGYGVWGVGVWVCVESCAEPLVLWCCCGGAQCAVL